MKNDSEKNRKNEEAPKNSALKEILSWVEVLVIAAVIALVVNNFIIANSQVPTSSMEDTILAGDRVIGLRLSYTFGEPKRGDVAIFKWGRKCDNCKVWIEWPDSDTCPLCGRNLGYFDIIHYVKRVIGLPGDKIEIRPIDEDGEYVAVYVNGEKINEPYLKEAMLDMPCDTEYEVPEGCYFLMGDNRNNSMDARFWNYHYVAKDRMVAPVLFRYWRGFKIIK